MAPRPSATRRRRTAERRKFKGGRDPALPVSIRPAPSGGQGALATVGAQNWMPLGAGGGAAGAGAGAGAGAAAGGASGVGAGQL